MNGWKTYLVGVAAILLGATEAIPKEWSNQAVAEVLGVLMVVLRAITTGPAVVGFGRGAFGLVAPLLVVGSLVGMTGCSASQGSGPTAGQCNALTIAASDVMLAAKCDRAPDPLKDEACISISVLRTAAALCLAQVQPAPPAS